MADRLPLVFDGTEIERLQSGDGLVDADGHGYVDSENAFSAQGLVLQTANTARGIEETAVETGDVVTAADAFGTDDVLIVSNGTAKGVEASSIAASEVVVDSDIANMVQSSSTFSAAGLLTQTADTSRGIEETSIETADVVTAASAFGTDEALIVADGTGKGTKASTITESDVSQAFDDIDAAEQDIDDIEADYVSAASEFGTDNVVLRADGTGRGAQLSNATLGDTGHLIIARTEGSNNITVGSGAGTSLSTATSCLFIGPTAGRDTVGGDQSVYVGHRAGQNFTTSSFNLGLGVDACRGATGATGNLNMCIGTASGLVLSTGSRNALIGTSAGRTMTTGLRNIGIGTDAARSIINGNDNTFIGDEAGSNASQKTDAIACIAIGRATFTTGDNAIAFGHGVSAGENQIVFGDSSHQEVFFPGILAVTSDPVSNGQFWVEDGFVRISDGSIAPQVFDAFVEGPDGATDDALAVWDGATGKLLQDSTVAIGDVVTAASAFGTDGVAIVADGTGKGVKAGYPAQTRFETYGAGTGYTITDTPAAIDMGTTDPVVVLTQAGTYRIRAWVEHQLFGGVGDPTVVTYTIRRTNNTAADLANGTTTFDKGSTNNMRRHSVYWEAGEYVTANTDDSITIFIDHTNAGNENLDVTRCFLKAERVA